MSVEKDIGSHVNLLHAVGEGLHQLGCLLLSLFKMTGGTFSAKRRELKMEQSLPVGRAAPRLAEENSRAEGWQTKMSTPSTFR